MLNIYSQKMSYHNCFFRKKISEFNRSSYENLIANMRKRKKFPGPKILLIIDFFYIKKVFE